MSQKRCGHGRQKYRDGVWSCEVCGETAVGRSLEATLAAEYPETFAKFKTIVGVVPATLTVTEAEATR